MSNPPPSLHSGTASQPHSEDLRLEPSIAKRQNAPENLKLLAAQRQLYSEAKTWQKVRTWSVLGVATLGVVSAMFVPSLLSVMGFLGAVTALAQWVAMHFIRQRTKVAAAVQEQFDTVVLQLPWNPHLVKKPDPEVVVSANARHRGDRNSLRDWYTVPPEAEGAYGIILAQRTNIRWDSELRQMYANSVLVGIVLLLIVITVVGMVKGLTLTEYVLALLPSLGAVLMGAETVRSHRQHANGQAELKGRIESFWERMTGNGRTVRRAELREIQDRIYQFRTLAPPVPDWFYWRHRNRFENETQAALESMWQDVAAKEQ